MLFSPVVQKSHKSLAVLIGSWGFLNKISQIRRIYHIYIYILLQQTRIFPELESACSETPLEVTFIKGAHSTVSFLENPPGCLHSRKKKNSKVQPPLTISHFPLIPSFFFMETKQKKQHPLPVRWRRYESCPRCWHLVLTSWRFGFRTARLWVYLFGFLCWNLDEHICYHLLYRFWCFLTIFHWCNTCIGLLFWKVTIILGRQLTKACPKHTHTHT